MADTDRNVVLAHGQNPKGRLTILIPVVIRRLLCSGLAIWGVILVTQPDPVQLTASLSLVALLGIGLAMRHWVPSGQDRKSVV